MDLSKFKTSDWLKVGGALGVIVFGFLKWVKIDFDGFGSVGGGNVFDFFWTGTLPWILIVASGVITALLATGNLKSKLPWPLIMLGATGLGALLLVLRLLAGPPGESIEGVGRGMGMILTPIAGIVAAVGGVLGFKESGGDLNDLKDMNKIKGAFNPGEGGTPPPPPPPPT